jgi:hypothetical protein
LATRESVTLAEVADEPIIGFDADLTIRREIDRALVEHRNDFRVVMEFDNIETIKRAVEIDAGVSLLPTPTVVREVEAGTLAAVPLEGGKLVRPLGIIHRRGKDLGVTARRFIDLLRKAGKPHSELAGASSQTEEEAFGNNGDLTSAGNGHANGHSFDDQLRSELNGGGNGHSAPLMDSSNGQGKTSKPLANKFVERATAS